MKVKRIFIIGVLLLLLLAPSAMADTNHSGTISSDETWGSGGNNHIITGDITVCGAVLTLGAGATVKFNSGKKIVVGGVGCSGSKLVVSGTSVNPVTITSNVASPAKGDWKYIWFKSNAAISEINHVTIEYGGGASLVPAAFVVSNDYLVLNHVQVRYSDRNGILVSGGDIRMNNGSIHDNDLKGAFVQLSGEASFDGVDIYDNYPGIRVDNSTVDIEDCDIDTNENYGVYALNSATVTITDSEFSENDVGLRAQNATLDITDSIIDGSTDNGAEVYNGADCTFDNTLINNSGDDGVAVDGSSTTATFTGDTSGGNYSNIQNNKKGIHITDGATVDLTDYEIVENHQLGIYVEDGDLTIDNCCIHRNGDCVGGAFSYAGVSFTAGIFIVDTTTNTDLHPGTKKSEIFDTTSGTTYSWELVNHSDVDFDGTYVCWYDGTNLATIEGLIYHDSDTSPWTLIPVGGWGEVDYSNPFDCDDACDWSN